MEANEVKDEVMTTEEPMETEVLDYTEEESSGSGKTLATVLAIGAGVIAAGAVIAKKLKDKKETKPGKKTKKRLRLIEIPVEEEEFDDDFEDEEAEDEEEQKKEASEEK